MTATACVLGEVSAERECQDNRWGEQNHPDVAVHTEDVDRAAYGEQALFWKRENGHRVLSDSLAWDGILLEEVFEALECEDPSELRNELRQVAAVAVAWIECLDRAE